MIRRCVLILISLLTLAASASAAGRDEAIPKDLRRLQDDIANLDDQLKDLEPGDPKADAFRDREDEIRENVIYLKVKMRRHQKAGREGTGVPLEEVTEIQTQIEGLREDIEAAFGQDGREVRLAEGTEIAVRLEDPLSSRTARREDRVEASVLAPVRWNGVMAIPAGTRVRGVVAFSEPAERPSRPGRLELEFDTLYAETQRLDLRARVVALEGSGRRPAEKAGIGAILGGVIGSLFDGRRGAIVGAIAGGSGAVVATKGDDVELPAGAVLTLRLDQELVIPRR
ncbi:MAG: hypothetical protein ACHQNV_05870 [Vicinamibacteria bacterium]